MTKQSVRRKKKRNFFAVFRVVPRVGTGLLKILFLLTIIAVISLSFLMFYNYLIASPYIKLQNVEVKGLEKEIRQDLIHMCGLNRDLSLLDLNLNDLKQKMESHIWVRSVKVERRFPHTLIIHAEQQTPAAVVVMDKIYYMNQHGELFKEINDWEETDFPIITGISGQGETVREKLGKALCIMKILEPEKGLWSLKQLSEIHVKKDGDLSLYFGHLAAEIRLMCEDLASKVKGLKKVAQHLSQSGRIHQVRAIDLNHVDGALVSFRKG